MAEERLSPAEVKSLFAEWKADYAARESENASPREIFAGFARPPEPARERLSDRVGADFFAVERMLDPGLGELLESLGVPAEARLAVAEYTHGVLAMLGEMERGVSRLCDVPGAENAGYGEKAKEGIERDGIDR